MRKGKVTDGYRRLAEKPKSLAEKAQQDKTKLAEDHATKLTKLHADLDLETHSYTEYRQNVCCQLCELHKTIASSFDEVKVQCLPFPQHRRESGGDDRLGCRGGESDVRYCLVTK
jgi:hypothetical protein